jgi:voltage-gated potassium channel
MSEVLSEYPAALRSFARVLRVPRHRAFAIAVVAIITVGVLFYSVVEGWSIVDSFYFTIILLATSGLGDLAPTSEASRLFTAVYAIIGFGTIGTLVHLVVRHVRESLEETIRASE